jgi:hypothetical protein
MVEHRFAIAKRANKMRSKDLIDYQGRTNKEIPYFQEVKGEKMSSELSSYQRGQLTEKEDRNCSLIIGGIRIFLPHHLGEVKVYVVDEETTTREGKPYLTVKEELEQILEASQVGGDENSEEWLNIFIQEVEKETTATMKLTSREEHGDKLITPWEVKVGNDGGM